MKLVIKIIAHLIFIIFLTITTQISGVLWLISLITKYLFKYNKRYTFPTLYLLFNLLIVPTTSNFFGRVKLPMFDSQIKPRNIIYPLLFRNYVTQELYDVLTNSSEQLKKENIQITYLDANFPFYDGFPLLPHRSHNDGKKIDISFMYTSKSISTNKKPSLSGYGAFVKENNTTANSCLEKGYWQYGFTKYLTLGKNEELKFDSKKTRILIKSFLNQHQTHKIFIEPYLKQKLNLTNYDKIRFHGCKAVRHDDHIHLQIK